MKNLLNKTGVPNKTPGDGLSHKDINSINNTVNEVVEASNNDLLNSCNVNLETGEFDKVFSFLEAISSIPQSRRKPGIVVKYLSVGNRYEELVFNYYGDLVSESDWLNEENWSLPFKEIDGGEWIIEDDF